MRSDEFVAFLKERGIYVFTVKEAAGILNRPAPYATKFIQRCLDIESIERIEKGKYCIKKTPIDIVASHIVHPSYLSLITALRFYNITTQLPVEKYVITTARHGDMAFRGYRMHFIKVGKRLLFGFGPVNGAIIANPEKAFIDSLYLKKDIWYNEELDTGLKSGVVSVVTLKKYAIALKDPSLISRLGHILELDYSINCDDLIQYSSRRYVALGRKGKKRDTRWKVIYNG